MMLVPVKVSRGSQTRRSSVPRATAKPMRIVQRVVTSSGPVRRMSCSTKMGEKTRRRKAMLKR